MTAEQRYIRSHRLSELSRIVWGAAWAVLKAITGV